MQTYTSKVAESDWGKEFQTLIFIKTGKKSSETLSEIIK